MCVYVYVCACMCMHVCVRVCVESVVYRLENTCPFKESKYYLDNFKNTHLPLETIAVEGRQKRVIIVAKQQFCKSLSNAPGSSYKVIG